MRRKELLIKKVLMVETEDPEGLKHPEEVIKKVVPVAANNNPNMLSREVNPQK